MFHLFERALDQRLQSHGVNIAQFRILLVLWEVGQATQNQIAKYLDIAQPTAANTLRRMERDRLIATRRDPSDARKQWVVPTAKGLRLKGLLTAEAQHVNAAATAGLKPHEAEHLKSNLKRLIGALQALIDKP